MSNLDDQLRELAKILSARETGYAAEAERHLAKIASSGDPDSIGGLLRMFDDTAPDELMFAIAHAIEMWDDQIYCKEMLNSVENLWKSSRRWAQILHVRIMNSPKTVNTYLKMLEAAPSSTRSVVRDIYEAIGASWPKIADKVTPILAGLSE